MTIAVRRREDAVEFGVRVTPGARRSAFVGAYGERLKVAVKAPPERGRANVALAALLATLLEVRPEDVEVVRGETSRDKTVRVRGAPAPALVERLNALVGATDSGSS